MKAEQQMRTKPQPKKITFAEIAVTIIKARLASA